MEVNTVAIKDESLLAAAKHIFGEDLVIDAFIAGTCHEGTGDALPTENGLLKSGPWNKGPAYEDYDVLDYDNRSVIIQFINGRFILFTNSDWAAMEHVSKDNIHFSAFSSTQCG